MFSSKRNVAVNSRQNNLIEFITQVVSSSITHKEVTKLEQAPGAWDDVYLTVLARMYMFLINERHIQMTVRRQQLIEPITIYKTVLTVEECRHRLKQKQSGGGRKKLNDADALAKPRTPLLHAFSLYAIVGYFLRENPFDLQPVKQIITEVKLPSTFVLKDQPIDEKPFSMSEALTMNLLKMYTLADHAAMHYIELKRYGDIYYDHRPPKTDGRQIESSTYVPMEIPLHLCALLTPEPSREVQSAVHLGKDETGNNMFFQPYPRTYRRFVPPLKAGGEIRVFANQQRTIMNSKPQSNRGGGGTNGYHKYGNDEQQCGTTYPYADRDEETNSEDDDYDSGEDDEPSDFIDCIDKVHTTITYQYA